MKSKIIAIAAVLALALPLMSGTAAAQAAEDEAKVDLNRATIEELIDLPGIGEKVAERIVHYRETNGPFQEPEELMNVRGIGEKTYLKLESRLTVTSEKSKKQ